MKALLDFRSGYLISFKAFAIIAIMKILKKGDVFESKNYGRFEIKNYINSKRILIVFIDTGFKLWTRSTHVRTSKVRDPLKPIVCGIGFTGVGEYSPSVNGRDTHEYKGWHGMITRCYNAKNLTRNKSYKNCKVCEEWHNFQNFAKWYNNNKPIDSKYNHQLDKDLFTNNLHDKIYSPNTCCFLPEKINGALQRCIGYYEDKQRGLYRVSVRMHDKECYIGRYNTKNNAIKAYCKAKNSYIVELANIYKHILSEEVYDKLIMYNIKNNLNETTRRN